MNVEMPGVEASPIRGFDPTNLQNSKALTIEIAICRLIPRFTASIDEYQKIPLMENRHGLDLVLCEVLIK